MVQPKSKMAVGPVMLSFFLFVVVGSGACSYVSAAPPSPLSTLRTISVSDGRRRV